MVGKEVLSGLFGMCERLSERGEVVDARYFYGQGPQGFNAEVQSGDFSIRYT